MEAGNDYVWGLGLIGQITAGNVETYAHADGLGSIRVLTDGTGASVGTQAYGAFGAARSQSGAQLTFTYTGEQIDPESGLVYLRARYMDPAQGRFTTKDPAPGHRANPSSLHDYIYASNSPINATDPTGLCTDPGGVGDRFCVDAFIPDDHIWLGLVGGDGRDTNPNGGTYRLEVLVWFDADGTLHYSYDSGESHIKGLPPREGTVSGSATCSQNSRVRTVRITGEGHIAYSKGKAPPFRFDFTISVGLDGKVLIDPDRTEFPSFEVWRYSDFTDPKLLYYYDDGPHGPTDLLPFDPIPDWPVLPWPIVTW